MDNNAPKQQELQIHLPPEVGPGIYSNLAVISHSGNEFFLDFISVAPNMPQARVLSRVVMTPENVKNLLYLLQQNVVQYEATFGEIKHKTPVAVKKPGNGGIPNPFEA